MICDWVYTVVVDNKNMIGKLVVDEAMNHICVGLDGFTQFGEIRDCLVQM